MQHKFTIHPIITTLYTSASNTCTGLLLAVWSLTAFYYFLSRTLSANIIRWALAMTLASLCAQALLRLWHNAIRKTFITVTSSTCTLFTHSSTQTMEFASVRASAWRSGLFGPGRLVLFSQTNTIALPLLMQNFPGLILALHAGMAASHNQELFTEKKFTHAQKRAANYMRQIDRLDYYWHGLVRLALVCALALGLIALQLWRTGVAEALWWMAVGPFVVYSMFGVANAALARKTRGETLSVAESRNTANEKNVFYAAGLGGIVLVLLARIILDLFT
jgi:hypothetical protein